MADTILVPVELPDPEPLSPVLVEDLSTLDIVLMGHYAVPEQTPTEAASDEFGDEAQATLNELAEPFRSAGADVTTRLVFGKDRPTAIDQVAIDEGCAAELDPAPTEHVGRILVPIPDVAEFNRLPEFIRILCEDSTQEITLFHVVEGEEDRARGEEIVEETKAGMLDAGFDPELVDTLLAEGSSHDDEIIAAAEEYDAVVMYEAESRLGDRIFGTLPDRIANNTGDPVIVVRRDYEPRVRETGET
jgi:nucleotide-binding universal stress UspA family protein